MRALAYARASRPNVLEAVLVATDSAERDHIIEEWDHRRIEIPLKILDSPYREIIRPVVDYARAIRETQSRGVVAVLIPEYVVGRWWEQRLRRRLPSEAVGVAQMDERGPDNPQEEGFGGSRHR